MLHIETQGATGMNATNTFLINFKLMKIFIFLCFHAHKNSQINHFNSIFKSGKFWGVTFGPGGLWSVQTSVIRWHITSQYLYSWLISKCPRVSMVDQEIPYKGDTKSFVPWYQWLASWHYNFDFNHVNIQGR